MAAIPPFPVMKVAFHTLGCRLNQSETAVLSSAFERAGYGLSEDGKGADVCVVNTCTVTGASDAKCRSSIRRLIRENPGARVAVIGCYAESGFKALSQIKGVDLIVGNQEKLNLQQTFVLTSGDADSQKEKRKSTHLDATIHS